MAHDAEHITTTASNLIQREGGFAAFVQNVGFGGIAYAIFLQAIEGINSFGELLLGPPRALGRGLILLVEVLIGGLVEVFGAGTGASVRSFANGTGALLGIFAQPVAVGIVMLSLATFIYAVNRLGITPFSFIRSFWG